jgi:hypothetical protein
LSETRAVINHNVTPLRADPSDRAEQISQAIFGETVRVLENSRLDYHEITTPDGYSGWARAEHISILETGERYPDPARSAMVAPLFLPVFREASGRSERVTLLTLGTAVELGIGDADAEFYPIRFPNGGIGYVEGTTLIVPDFPAVDRLGPNLAVVARGMIGVPYLWGGRTPFGIDCSGFVQRVYWLCGQTIPRDAYRQAEWEGFQPIEREDLGVGDLVFFRGERDPRNRGITHVGLSLANGTFIHASSALGVAITPLDDPDYSRQFVCARRYRP